MFYKNYKELESSVVDWMDRQDIADKIPQFIRFITTNVMKTVRVQIMERSMIIPVYENGIADIPYDLVEAISVNWLDYKSTEEGEMFITDRTPLNRGSVYTMNKLKGALPAKPEAFTDIGRNFKVYPVPKAGDLVVGNITAKGSLIGYIEVTYYALPMELDSENESNWILEIAPELYFYGCMAQACQYTRDFENAAYWEDKYNKAVRLLQAWSDKAEDAGGPIVVGDYNE